jgi:Ca2+-binding RTX toxin-like protein
MNRLYNLLTVMVVMVLTGTGGDNTLVGTDRDDRLDGRGGDDEIEGGSGNDAFIPGEGDDEVYAGAGQRPYLRARHRRGGLHRLRGGFDKVETIHRNDRTKSNCERSLGPRQGDI